jgi:hypothetical protein
MHVKRYKFYSDSQQTFLLTSSQDRVKNVFLWDAIIFKLHSTNSFQFFSPNCMSDTAEFFLRLVRPLLKPTTLVKFCLKTSRRDNNLLSILVQMVYSSSNDKQMATVKPSISFFGCTKCIRTARHTISLPRPLLKSEYVRALSKTRSNCSSLLHLVHTNGQYAIFCFFAQKPTTAVPRLRRLAGSL